MTMTFKAYGKTSFVVTTSSTATGWFAWTLSRVGGGQIAHGSERTEADAIEAAKNEARDIEVASHYA